MRRLIVLVVILSIFTINTQAQEKAILRNNIAVNMSDIIFQRLSFDFERLLENGEMAITVPISVRFGEPKSESDNNSFEIPVPFPFTDQMLDETDWYIGLGFMFYPKGSHRKFRFYFGPEIRFGEATHVNIDYHYDSQNGMSTEEYSENHYNNASFLMNVGLKVYPTEELFLAIKFAGGAYTSHDKNIGAIVSPGFKIGLSF